MIGRMRNVGDIDAHVLVWWVSGHASLSAAALEAIEKNLTDNNEVVVSAISAWEISMLIQKGWLVLNMELERWFDEITKIDGVRFLPADNEIGVKSTMLPGDFHKDPADRMIVATARALAAPLVTADEKIINYEHVETLW